MAGPGVWIGLSMLPAMLAALPGAAQEPAAKAAEDAITAPGPQGPLAGTLERAGEGAPVVLMIPGSGPTDRDGNNALGVRAASLRLLAEALAQQGIASVRVDKRGMFGSKAAVPDANAVTIGAYADDVASWITVIRARTGAPCVWVLGHSEGGLVALAAAARGEAGICGLVLVSTLGRPYGEVLRAQFRANPANAPLLPDAEKVLDSLEAGQPIDVSGMHPAIGHIFQPAVQPFLIDAFRYDPPKMASKYPDAVLIVSGGRDLQIAESDAAALAAADPRAQRLDIADMNHVLKAVESDDKQANFAAYGNPALPLAPGLAEGIAAFIKAHPMHR